MSTPESTPHYSFPPDIAASMESLISQFGYASEDHVLRFALGKLLEDHCEEEDDWPAIQEAIEDLERGVPCTPIDEVFAEIRRRYQLPEA